MAVEVEIDGDPALRAAAEAALDAAGVDEGHLAVVMVSEGRMRELNREHRGIDSPTDVLAFPIDDEEPVGPRELGDVFVCPECAHDVVEVVVHGVLHLCGMDHETDSGEMLALQDRVVAGLRS